MNVLYDVLRGALTAGFVLTAVLCTVRVVRRLRSRRSPALDTSAPDESAQHVHVWRRPPRRGPDRWAAPCRDEARRRRRLLVVLTEDHRLALVLPPGEVGVLDLLRIGELRAVLREAVFALDDSRLQRPHQISVPLDSDEVHVVDRRGRHRPRWLSRLRCRQGSASDVDGVPAGSDDVVQDKRAG